MAVLLLLIGLVAATAPAQAAPVKATGFIALTPEGPTKPGVIDAPKDLVQDTSQTYTLPDGGTVTPVVSFTDLNKVSAKVKWWGIQVRFNRSETIRIGGGATACAAFIGGLPIPGIAKKVITGSCGAMAAWAGSLVASGRCLAHNAYYMPPGGHPWSWDC